MALLLGGGVWRIKFSPHAPNLVLTGCMHNGSAVYNIFPKVSTMPNDELTDHEQCTYLSYAATELLLHHPSTPRPKMLAYGVDWAPELPRENAHKYVTSSFYERTMEIVTFISNDEKC